MPVMLLHTVTVKRGSIIGMEEIPVLEGPKLVPIVHTIAKIVYSMIKSRKSFIATKHVGFEHFPTPNFTECNKQKKPVFFDCSSATSPYLRVTISTTRNNLWMVTVPKSNQCKLEPASLAQIEASELIKYLLF